MPAAIGGVWIALVAGLGACADTQSRSRAPDIGPAPTDAGCDGARCDASPRRPDAGPRDGGTHCDGGVCRACASGLEACEGSCVDLRVDRDHCGACGARCFGPCIAGECVCPSESSCCDGAPVDLRDDPAHCGACGNECGAERACVDGACVELCAGPDRGMCGDECVDWTADPRHCGACGAACDSAEVCTGGACTCGPEGLVCAGRCVDPRTDPAHCGACYRRVPPGYRCDAGVAVARPCGADYVRFADPDRCWACDAEGMCSCGPDDGVAPSRDLALCGGACVDLRSDGLHCGACDSPCREDERCDGVCRAITACDGVEAVCPPIGSGLVLDDRGTGFTGVASHDPSLVWTGSDVVAAWTRYTWDPEDLGVYLTRITLDRTEPAANVRLDDRTSAAWSGVSLVWTGTDVVAVWGGDDLSFARLSPDGTLRAPVSRLVDHPVGASLVWTGVELALAFWERGAPGSQLLRLAADGTPLGAAVAVPGVGALVWLSSSSTFALVGERVFFMAPTGEPLGPPIDVGVPPDRRSGPVLATSGDVLALAWSTHVPDASFDDRAQVWATLLSSDGSVLVPPTRLATRARDVVLSLAVTWIPARPGSPAGGSFLVAWGESSDSIWERVRVGAATLRVDGTCAVRGPLVEHLSSFVFLDDPALVWAGDRLGVAWGDGYEHTPIRFDFADGCWAGL